MSTTKIFILVAVISLALFAILAGPNPFSFGEAYFRTITNPPQLHHLQIRSPDPSPVEIIIDQ